MKGLSECPLRNKGSPIPLSEQQKVGCQRCWGEEEIGAS